MVGGMKSNFVQSSRSAKEVPLPSRRRLLATNIVLIFYIIFGVLINGLVEPLTKRGFFCNDSTLQYPINSDTISFLFLMLIALFCPMLVIKACDKVMSYKEHRDPSSQPQRPGKVSGMQNQDSDGDQRIPETIVKRRLVVNEDDDAEEDQILCNDNLESDSKHLRQRKTYGSSRRRAFSDLQLFLFGFATTGLMTGIGKITCGRLRPHFMQRCRPNVNCSLPVNFHRYIEDYSCTSEMRRRDSIYIATSWPSGHASIIFYSMLYMIIYLDTVITAMRRASSARKAQPILMGCIYVLMLGLAIYVSMTRISDYHHHPTDVFSGTVIGSLIAFLNAKCLLQPSHMQLRVTH